MIFRKQYSLERQEERRYTYSQDVIYKPEGALIQSLRNDDKSEIMISGCYDGLKMDNINNLYDNYWGFKIRISTRAFCSIWKMNFPLKRI
jgi:hypothetical protein